VKLAIRPCTHGATNACRSLTLPLLPTRPLCDAERAPRLDSSRRPPGTSLDSRGRRRRDYCSAMAMEASSINWARRSRDRYPRATETCGLEPSQEPTADGPDSLLEVAGWVGPMTRDPTAMVPSCHHAARLHGVRSKALQAGSNGAYDIALLPEPAPTRQARAAATKTTANDPGNPGRPL
jgi:hypothetical protein